jgi:hypothetical protein
LVHHTIKDKFIKHTIEEIEALGTNPEESTDLLNCQFKKLAASDQFIGESKILYGNQSRNFYIALLY